MRLPFDAARMHMQASSHVTRHLKGRHQSGGRRSAAQSSGAQRTPAGGRTTLGALGRLMRAIWQRMSPPADDHVLPIPVKAPVLRVVSFASFHRTVPTMPLTGARPYTLRAHAQARWRSLAG